jgi:hypothetical protein
MLMMNIRAFVPALLNLRYTWLSTDFLATLRIKETLTLFA